jgi:isopenicillin-N epimerase
MNGGKWVCCPKGTAFLWASEVHHSKLKPLVISHGFGHSFQSDFSWDGCRDYSSLLCIPAALSFWQSVGTEKTRNYCVSLAHEAATMLADRWGTETLVPLSLCGPMVLVRIPIPRSALLRPPTSADAKDLQDRLYNARIEVPVKCIAGNLYTRISAHAYNTLSDYEQLGSAGERIFVAWTESRGSV